MPKCGLKNSEKNTKQQRAKLKHETDKHHRVSFTIPVPWTSRFINFCVSFILRNDPTRLLLSRLAVCDPSSVWKRWQKTCQREEKLSIESSKCYLILSGRQVKCRGASSSSVALPRASKRFKRLSEVRHLNILQESSRTLLGRCSINSDLSLIPSRGKATGRGEVSEQVNS